MGKRVLLALIPVFILAGLMSGAARAQGLSPQETWVMQQVAGGFTADLREKFGPEEKSRHLRGRFLEALLTGEMSGFKAHRRGVSIKNAVIPDYVSLRSAEIAQAVELQACRFPAGLDCGYALFKKSLSLDGSIITGMAMFNGMKVESDASFNGTEFQGGTFFEGANIQGRLSAREVRFTGKLGAQFTNLQVGSDADFSQALFQADTFCSRMRVKGNFVIFNSVFEKQAFFDGTEVGGDFNAINAQFRHPQAPVYLVNLKVGQMGLFTGLKSQGGVSLAMAQFRDLFLGNSEPAQIISYKALTLDYAVVERVLDLRNLEVDKLSAKKLTAKDLAFLDNVRLKDEARLDSSSFFILMLIKVAWPQTRNRVWLDEMTYQALHARDNVAEEKPQDWLKLLDLLQISRFNTQNYSQLESYFQRRGEKDRADEVFIQGKRREILQKWWRPTNLATFIFWDLLAGYGRKPSRTLWISFSIVLLGMLFFDPKNFDPSFVGGWGWLLNGDRRKTGVIRFFLSLDEFLPGVDLGLARLWQISQISFGTLLYYHFHKIAGWILIPIALAAVYTQFK
ncbi:MAG: pentapeptide repeat-containing protein [Thermodesulfobacteriota bacterium]